MKLVIRGLTLLAMVIGLSACADYYNPYPAVTVSNAESAADSGHYGPPAPPPSAAESSHYGPSAESYPSVTVTNSGNAASTAHYGY